MKSCRMVLTVKKVAPAPPPTSPAQPADGAAAEDGFTLLEVICVVAITAMLAAIFLPAIPRATSRPQLESYAVEIASLLKSDRFAAIRRRSDIVTEVDARSRTLRSGARAQIIRVPNDVTLTLVSAATCQQQRAGASIVFLASGMSCGGTIALTRLGVGYEIRVNWLTGGVEVVPRRAI
jgi:general secretion pathway protein H